MYVNEQQFAVSSQAIKISYVITIVYLIIYPV